MPAPPFVFIKGNLCKQIVAETRERSFLLRFMRIPTRNSHVGACIFGHSTIVIFFPCALVVVSLRKDRACLRSVLFIRPFSIWKSMQTNQPHSCLNPVFIGFFAYRTNISMKRSAQKWRLSKLSVVDLPRESPLIWQDHTSTIGDTMQFSNLHSSKPQFSVRQFSYFKPKCTVGLVRISPCQKTHK